MRVPALFLGAALVTVPSLARALTIYDSVDVDPQAFNGGWDAVEPTQVGPLAGSFLPAYPVTLDYSVSLELQCCRSERRGIPYTVVLMQANGFPSYRTTNGITTFPGATVLATILDSSLSGSPSLVTITTAVNLSATRCWIGLETPRLPSSVAVGDTAADGSYGSAQWWWTDPRDEIGAIGLAGQSDFNTYGGAGPYPVGGNQDLGPYEMIIDVPEPATLTVLGGGLAGLASSPSSSRKARKGLIAIRRMHDAVAFWKRPSEPQARFGLAVYFGLAAASFPVVLWCGRHGSAATRPHPLPPAGH